MIEYTIWCETCGQPVPTTVHLCRHEYRPITPARRPLRLEPDDPMRRDPDPEEA